MALIDDIEFYGRAVDAGEMDRQVAARLLVETSGSRLTEPCAARWLDNWQGARARLESKLFDVTDTLRALKNGRPVPGHVTRHMHEGARAEALRMIRRHDTQEQQ